MSQHHNRLAHPSIPRASRLAFTLLLAIPLALLALAPLTRRVAAHPAHPTQATRPAIGKSSGPAMDLTLHFRSMVGTFSTPYRMGMDAQGDLYVSDLSDNFVRMYNPTDTFVRDFGSGSFIPEGVAVSGTTVFVVDWSNHQIQTFNKTTGTFLSAFGASQLYSPFGITLASNGTLYIANAGDNDIAEFSTSGTYLGSFGSFGSGTGQFHNPSGIAASSLGFLYVTDSANHRVEQFTLGGTYLNQWGSASFGFPDGITVDRAGMVYVVDQTAQTVYKFDVGGSLVGSYAAPPTTPFVPGTFVTPGDVAVRSVANTPLAVYVSDMSGVVERFDQVINPQYHTYQSQWGGYGSGNGQFEAPVTAVVDNAGNVYVTDYYYGPHQPTYGRIEKFDQFGNFLLNIGYDHLITPGSLAISPDGSTLYVSDAGGYTFTNVVYKYSPSGTYLGQFGGSGSGNGQFNGPAGIATDGTFIYVADCGNNRVEKFDTSGTYISQFGSAGSGTGQFNCPGSIALDIARQELFIADSYNSRVEAFTTGGSYIASLTMAGGVNFNRLGGVSTDQRGDVYVVDTGSNDRFVEFDVNLTHVATFGPFGYPTDVVASPANGQIYIVDASIYLIQRWGSPWPREDTVGIYRPSAKTFYLRNSNSTGPANITVPMPYAQAGDLPVVGDWNGDGVDTVGLYRPSTGNFLLQDANVSESAPDYTFTLGNPGDTPIAGDWNGDGTSGAGIFRPSNGILYLKNALNTGYADESLVLGVPGDKGIAGDWNGDGQDSPGVYRPSNQTFYVTNKVTNGIIYADATAVLGISGDAPFTGDWVVQGSSGIGVFRPSNGITYEKNAVSTGFADNFFIYGIAGDIPVAGQWIAQQVTFSAPAPHTSLGTRTTSMAPRPTSGKPGPAGPASVPARIPAAATPSAPRHKAPSAR